ncbi:hypothetical protein HZC32_03890 [Candidatus Woesearchaeota archaeon]|nr:hypothetical protein [Candidatus Woesearchaeota archaeon]
MKSKLKKLPLHSWKVHPVAQKGEANKTFVIAIVAVIAIVILTLLLFFGKQFVGKAIFTTSGTPPYSVGIFLSDEDKVIVGTSFEVPVVVNIGKDESSVFGFKLKYDSAHFKAGCDDQMLLPLKDNIIDVDDPDSLLTYWNTSCTTGVIELSLAWLGNPITGEKVIVTIPVTALSTGEGKFEFEYFDVYNLSQEGKPISLKINDATIVVTPLIQCPEGEECCGGTTPIDLLTDDANCGDCGTKCGTNEKCVDSRCVVFSCLNGAVDPPDCSQCLAEHELVAGECTAIDKCADVANPCTKNGDKQCSTDKTTLQMCTYDVKSCLYWSPIQTCAADEICKDSSCQKKPPVEPITIDVISKKTGTAVESPISSGEYTIKVNITPTESLPANHVVIVSVNHGNENKAMVKETKPALIVSNSEVVEFTHKIESAVNISVVVWNGLLSEGFDFKQLVPPKEKSYEIS